jgi:hypothetical protein
MWANEQKTTEDLEEEEEKEISNDQKEEGDAMNIS